MWSRSKTPVGQWERRPAARKPFYSSVLFCSVYILHFPSSQGTVCLDIEYVPPGGRDGQSEQQGDGDETDEDEDHDEDEDQEDKDEHDHDKGKETRRKKGKKRMPRRRIARKWSDKIKDFQVMWKFDLAWI